MELEERNDNNKTDASIAPSPQSPVLRQFHVSKPRIAELLRKKARLGKCRSTIPSDLPSARRVGPVESLTIKERPWVNSQMTPQFATNIVMSARQVRPFVAPPHNFLHLHRNHYYPPKGSIANNLLNMRATANLLLAPMSLSANQSPRPIQVPPSISTTALQIQKLMQQLVLRRDASQTGSASGCANRLIFSQRMLSRKPQKKHKPKVDVNAILCKKPVIEDYYPGTARSQQKRIELLAETAGSRPETCEGSRPDSRYNRETLCSTMEDCVAESGQRCQFAVRHMNLAEGCGGGHHLLPSCWS